MNIITSRVNLSNLPIKVVLIYLLRNVDKYRIFGISWNDEAVTFLATERFNDSVTSWSGTGSFRPTVNNRQRSIFIAVKKPSSLFIISWSL